MVTRARFTTGRIGAAGATASNVSARGFFPFGGDLLARCETLGRLVIHFCCGKVHSEPRLKVLELLNLVGCRLVCHWSGGGVRVGPTLACGLVLDRLLISAGGCVVVGAAVLARITQY